MRARRAWLVLAFILWLAGVAAADTGGRMGGGSWGSSRSSSSSSYSSSRSSSSSSYSSSRSYSSSPSYDGSYSSGGGGVSAGLLFLLIAGGLVIVVLQAMAKSRADGPSYDYSSVVGSYVPLDSIDV